MESVALQDQHEHPMEVARRALMDAARLEGPRWAEIMVRFASALPPRPPLPQAVSEEA